ncbi:MAG TPA: glycosyltransferase [Lacipirellulaceae bacterium]|nr:glycosyltransferase [Lacipirellulaceae bacterium]
MSTAVAAVDQPNRFDVLVSVLVVVQDDAPILSSFLTELNAELSRRFHYYEVLIIDLASRDETPDVIDEQLQKLPFLRFLRLSARNQKEIGIAAALEHCIGDYAVLMNPYFDRPSDIERMVSVAQQGFEVVVARRAATMRPQRWRTLFYALARNMLGVELSSAESDFQTLSRKAVASLTKIKNRRRWLKYFNSLLGFRKQVIDTVPRDPPLKAPSRNFLTALQQGIDILISHSATPLRWAAALGVLASMGNLAYLLYVFVVALVKNKLAEGWLTMSIMLSTMFFCLFVILAVLAEYVARIMEESQERPLYFIELEAESVIAPPHEREEVNVIEGTA